MLVGYQGIVLRQSKFKDNDKILTIFSKEHGKVQAIAKGARKPRSKLMASTQNFCYSDFVAYRGKNFYNINQGDVIQSFYTLRENLYSLAYGTYIMELVEAGIVEEESNTKLFALLLRTLEVLSRKEDGYEKLVRAFELKFMSFIGYKPYLKACVHCNGALRSNLKFSSRYGGVLCEACAHTDPFGERIGGQVLRAIYDLLYSPLDKLDELDIDLKILDKIETILMKYILEHTDKTYFKSLDFLKSIK